MAEGKQKIGWIGMGRMGYPMAERLIKAGYDVSIWNRTRSKAEPLTKIGGKVVDNLLELKDVDVLFSIVSTGKDLEQVYFGNKSVTGHGGKLPKIFVDCSTIAVEESASIRDRLQQLGCEYVAAPGDTRGGRGRQEHPPGTRGTADGAPGGGARPPPPRRKTLTQTQTK